MSRKTIAVVEDNADNRLLVRALLQGRFEVDEYEAGATALEAFSVSPPALILLDISLPDMDGMEVLERIRADAALAEIPVIALTAHAMATDRDRFIDAGFDEYVPKPITSEETLLGAIDRLLK